MSHTFPYDCFYSPDRLKQGQRDPRFSYLGGNDPVITEFGWYERFSGRTGRMANIDSSAVYSPLITTKLENNREGEGGR